MTQGPNQPIEKSETIDQTSNKPSGARTAVTFIVWLMVFSALALFAVTLWRLQQSHRLTLTRVDALESQNRQLQEALEIRQRSEASVSEHQVKEIQTLEESMDNLRAEISGGAQSFAETQRVHAATYLVHQAALHIDLGRDVQGAVSALNAAQAELQSAVSEKANRLRSAIVADVQTLAKVNITSPLEIARTLNQVQVKVNQLEPLRTTLGNGDKGLNLIEARDGWLGTLRETWQQYAGEWFVVRRHEDVVHAPPDVLENRKIKLALSLALSEAQLASVHSDTMLFAESLKRARSLAIAFYNETDLGEGIVADIDDLLARQIALDEFSLASEQEAKK